MINVVKKTDCVGCWACYSRCPKKCITMVSDEEGFLYPKVDEKQCVNCHLCEEVCPVLHLPQLRKVRQTIACINQDAVVRAASSSGGTFSLLADYVLEQGGTVFGAAFVVDFTVHHIGVDTKKDLALLRGSKYVQSRIEDSFRKAKQLLLQDKLVLFSGTPCQIAGFRRFVGKDYENLYLVDVVCHGIPSAKVYAEKLKEAEQIMGESIEHVAFRDKSTGWKTCSFVVQGKNKEVRESKSGSLYMKAFLQNMSVRPSCSVCHYNNQHSSADVTIADYWGVETKFPELNDEQGVTVVLVNTLRGARLLKAATNNRAKVLPTDFEHAAEHNFAMTKVSQQHANREKFFKQLGTKPLNKLITELL
ncbi:MAG: Coenzyme F420 hydrogenase/dehydrogenase, beta subunit C-terminal domain [Acidaminococcaceae bacterium]|nr:Coenzyme F420 hydrogenase/dehydrogenase, beta subunit C-terminal domain [Acidaminococcaceae bacterium]